MDVKSKTVTVKVPRAAYDVLSQHAGNTKRTLAYLLERAILRCYGNGKEGQ